MLEKEMELLFAITSPANRDETVTYESRKTGADNSLQFNRIMKSSKPSLAASPSNKLLNSTAYFKKGYFDEVSISIETRNNCPKSSILTVTIFYCINSRQIQKDVIKEILNYVDMKILTQVNPIRNPSESEIREARSEDPVIDFVYCTFPTYEGSKLIGVEKHICMIMVLGDPSPVFFDNSFSDGNEKKAPWLCQK